VTTFLILCAVMIVAALALILVPLLRNTPTAAGEDRSGTRAVPAAVVVMIALPLAASAFYGATSNFPWDNPGALATGAAAHSQSGGSMEEVTAQLEARLQKNPGDLEGWRMLGRTYLVSGRVDDAVAAYERASAITGGQDPALELDLAEALVLSSRPDAQGRARTILDSALAADENNQKALWYSGLMAVRANDPDTAKKQWTRLLDTNPPEEIRQILVAQLAELGAAVPQEAAAASSATAAMGGATPMRPSSAAAGGASGRTIRIAVSVDPTLAGKVTPGTAVFVSAREAGIPGPPIAAVRIAAEQLPTTVVLSDANSLIEGRTLSSVDEVQVVARVAFGGTAMTASGDLIGQATHRKGAPEDLSVVINKVSP
jgi:cytochrome c-type biogenesis protein CcmH